MLLQCPMEEKQLNLEKPLLSVRRFTSGAAPDNESKRKIYNSRRTVPRPPPYKSELKSGPIRDPGTVPFVWEQSPGRPKDESKPRPHMDDTIPTVPKLPPGRASNINQQYPDKAAGDATARRNQAGSAQYIQYVDENVVRSGSSNDGKEEVKNSSSGDEEEEYVDALDKLSRTESFFINCSVSGLSGLEDPGMRLSGSSPIDPQTREFMMGRFLPAAKAMASETTQHTPRKPPVVQHELRQPKKLLREEEQPRLRYGLDYVPDYSHCHDNGDAESDGDCDDQENFPGKVCGLLPRLGLRSSFCLLNPLPGMSVRSRAPMPTLRKSQTSSSGSRSEADNEQYLLVGEKSSPVRSGTPKLQAGPNDFINKDIPLIPNNHETSEHISASVRYSEHDAAGRSPIEAKCSKGNGSELDRIVLRSFEELLAEESRSQDLDTGSLVAERTLYVEPLNLKSDPSDPKAQSGLEVATLDFLMEKTDRSQTSEFSLKDIEKLSILEEGAKSEPKFQIPDFHVKSSTDQASQNMRFMMLKYSGKEQDRYKGSTMSTEKFTKMQQMAKLRSEKLETDSGSPLPPPLPRSPTDSWLGRTLPSMSIKNASVHPFLGVGVTSKHQASKPKSSDPKWETIVKMTKMPDQHLRYSEERLTPIPEA